MVNNTATAIASTSSGNGDVTDLSDDPNTVAANDPTTVPIKSDNSISLTKASSVVDTAADGRVGTGDTVNYTIIIENTGIGTLRTLVFQIL